MNSFLRKRQVFFNLTGIILTRADGDARGGAAVSMKYVSNVPIKFLGIGEKIDNIEGTPSKNIRRSKCKFFSSDFSNPQIGRETQALLQDTSLLL